MHILGSSRGIYIQVFPQTNLIAPHMYTNIKINQHKITQLTWIHLVHTCNIWKFDTVPVLIFFNLSDNW